MIHLTGAVLAPHFRAAFHVFYYPIAGARRAGWLAFAVVVLLVSHFPFDLLLAIAPGVLCCRASRVA